MPNPELDVRRIRITVENEFFHDLVEPFSNNKRDRISTYRLRHIIPKDEDSAYAVYEANHNIVAVQFYLDDNPLTFGDNESVQFMSVNEVRLIRELGEISIDGISLAVENIIFNLIDGADGCQHIIIFNLKRNY